MENMKCLSSSALKVIAMVCMLCDHLWTTIIPGNLWLTMVGRIAYPIFAFQVVEGFCRTSDPRRYRRRIFLCALITEIPFNLVCADSLLYPFHQNVLFTFWLSLLVLGRLSRARERGGLSYILNVVLFALIGALAGDLLMVDYFGYGVLMVVLFYLCRDLPWGWPALAAGMVCINVFLMEGQTIPLLNGAVEFPIQALALLALIPIALYNGEKGRYHKLVQPLCYAFYPAHLLVLFLLGRVL